jgi:alkylhydroperoxidase family enzyme
MSARIPPLGLDNMPANLAQYLNDTKVKRLGYLGEFFQCTAHNPEVLLSFMQFTDALGKAVPKNFAEIGALTVAGAMENAYERNQHERLCEKLGFTREWIAAVNRLQPERASELSEAERAVQGYALAAIARRGVGVRQEFEAMLNHLTAAQAMAIVMYVGRYVCHALVVNTLELRPPVPSIFEQETSQ